MLLDVPRPSPLTSTLTSPGAWAGAVQLSSSLVIATAGTSTSSKRQTTVRPIGRYAPRTVICVPPHLGPHGGTRALTTGGV